MTHKEKCKVMKGIRKKIADAIGVDLHQVECTYQGECSGTCPKCAQEERILNRALLGGTALACGVTLTACNIGGEPLEGAPQPMPTTEVYMGGLESDPVQTTSEEMTSETETASVMTEIIEGVIAPDETDMGTEEFILSGEVAEPYSETCCANDELLDQVIELCISLSDRPDAVADHYGETENIVYIRCYDKEDAISNMPIWFCADLEKQTITNSLTGTEYDFDGKRLGATD